MPVKPGRNRCISCAPALLPDGNILFAHQYGVSEITVVKTVLWNYEAPTNTEIHTAQAIGTNRVFFIQNGNPARLIIKDIFSGQTETEFELSVGNPKSTQGQFRHARLTPNGTIMVAHMDLGKAVEYDLNGKEL